MKPAKLDGLIASAWISIRQEMPDDIHYIPAARLTPSASYQDPDDGEYWYVAHDSGWLKCVPASRLTAAQEQVERLREALEPARIALARIDDSTDDSRMRTGREAENHCFYAVQRALSILDHNPGNHHGEDQRATDPS